MRISKGGAMRTPFIILLILVILGAAGFVYWRYFYQQPAETSSTTTTTSKDKVVKLDAEKVATHLSQVGETKGVYWLRGFDLIWDEVEFKKGDFDWDRTDEKVEQFAVMNIYPLLVVKPFANWDQNSCHPEEKYEAEYEPVKGGNLKVGKPCDMIAYADFLTKAVERYDGDGKDDMPGLTIPIKYWEIMNEPEMQGGSTGGMGEELKFFVGTSQEYFDILKTSYQTIKKADPEAKIAHAGMAGMQQSFQDFWDPIFALGAGDYFDIANIHTINTDDKREDLYMVKFLDYLSKYGLENKPIWITEVQYGELVGKPADVKSFEVLMAKSTVLSLALGADKLFYIENWVMWDQEKLFKSEDKEKESSKEKEESAFLKDSSTHKVYLNLVDKVNNFDKVEIIEQKYQQNSHDFDGVTSISGQYKFVFGSKEIYVLWGKAELPAEISGQVKVTDIYGDSQEINAVDINLSNQPIFVELL